MLEEVHRDILKAVKENPDSSEASREGSCNNGS